MLNSQFATGLLLGVDSFLVCFAVGTLPGRLLRRTMLGLSFGVCDGLASWIGCVAGMGLLRSTPGRGEWIGPLAVAGYGVYVLWVARRCQGLSPRLDTTRWLVLALPLGLSLDNLVAGVGAGAPVVSPVLTALFFGAASGAMALAGLGAGAAVATRSRLRPGWLGGACLILVAGGLVLKEALLELTAAS